MKHNRPPQCKNCGQEMTDVSSRSEPAYYECRNNQCPSNPKYDRPDTPKMYDPYYIIDPTEPLPAPELGRTHGGKFNGYSILRNFGGEHCLPDSGNWANVAKAEKKRLEAAAQDDEPTASIFYVGGKDTQCKFTWRMIAEMLEAAANYAEQNPSDIDGIRKAAYDHLRAKQYETARTLLERKIEDILHQKAEDVSEALSDWMGDNFDTIPEVKF